MSADSSSRKAAVIAINSEDGTLSNAHQYSLNRDSSFNQSLDKGGPKTPRKPENDNIYDGGYDKNKLKK